MVELNEKSKGYAQALFQSTFDIKKGSSISQKQNAIIIAEELSLIKALIFNSLKLKALLQNQTVLETKKVEVLLSFFPEMSNKMQAFLKVLAEKGQLKTILNICEEYQKILAKFNSVTNVKLSLAGSLDESYGSSFLIALKKLTGSKEVIVKPIFSPRALGGLVLEYNSKIINISIANEIRKLL